MELEIYRPGGEFNQTEALLAAEIAARMHAGGGRELEPAGVVDSKFGPVTLLRLADEGWSAEDWQTFFDERAGIAEFDGALPRPQAEERAFTCCVVEWLNRSAVSSMPGL